MKVSLVQLTDKQVEKIAQLCGAYEDEGSYYCGVEEGHPVVSHKDLKRKLEDVITNGVEGT